MKEYVHPRWMRNSLFDLIYFPGGNIEVGAFDIEKTCEEEGIELTKISWRAYIQLKEWMLEHDPDRIVVSNREEDLKVIHRLLDIQEKMVGSS